MRSVVSLRRGPQQRRTLLWERPWRSSFRSAAASTKVASPGPTRSFNATAAGPAASSSSASAATLPVAATSAAAARCWAPVATSGTAERRPVAGRMAPAVYRRRDGRGVGQRWCARHGRRGRCDRRRRRDRHWRHERLRGNHRHGWYASDRRHARHGRRERDRRHAGNRRDIGYGRPRERAARDGRQSRDRRQRNQVRPHQLHRLLRRRWAMRAHRDRQSVRQDRRCLHGLRALPRSARAPG